MSRQSIVGSKARGRRISSSTLVSKRTRRNSGEPTRSFIEDEENFIINRIRLQPDVDKARNGVHLHVSDLLSTCLRMKALTVRSEQRRHDRYVDEGSGVTYALGHAIQGYVARRMQQSNPEEMYGNWSCACGATNKRDTYAKVADTLCPKCSTHLFNYGELRLISEQYGITGSIDLTLFVDGAFHLTEIKSIKHELWMELSGPVPDHKLQLMLYYWLALHNNLPTHNKISVLYVSKANMFKSPLKEFSIDPRQEYETRLAPYLEEAARYKAAIADTKAKLPKRVCSSANSGTAKKCSMCALCFSIPE